MGMDIYGENPTLVKGLNKPIRPKDEEDNQEQWSEYYKQKRYWENINVGIYFRANIWSWRPIWAMVEKLCDDILTEEDIKHGSYNDGFLIDTMKAELLGQRLKQNKGHIEQYCKDQKADFEVKNEFNKLLTKSAEVYLKIQKIKAHF